MDFLTILPNLSIGVVCILALIYVVRMYKDYQERREAQYTAERVERDNKYADERMRWEAGIRELERDFRGSIATQLNKSNEVLSEVSRTMERVTRHLDKHV